MPQSIQSHNAPHNLVSITRRGVTKVDVVVIRAVGFFLLQRVFPLLNMARESSRRTYCSRNLMKIGQALQSYHDIHGTVPPAAVWESSDLDINQNHLVDTQRDTQFVMGARQNWFQMILPNLDLVDLSESFDPMISMMDPRNSDARTSECNIMRCPSDHLNTPENPYIHEAPNGTKSHFARGNYAINGGTQTTDYFPGQLSYPSPNGGRFAYDPKSRIFQF